MGRMKFTLLIVDDEKNIREGLAANFEMEDYNVKTASNGADALKLLEKGDIDLVKSAGKEILKISEFTAQKENDSLYRFVIADDEGNETEFYVSLYSYSYGTGEDMGGEGDE